MLLQDAITHINDIGIHYRYKGTSVSQCLVFLHGLASTCRIWDKTIEHLPDLSVISVDQRGHGETQKPQGDYGFKTFVKDLHGLIESHEISRPVVIGHSWGGCVAIEYAAQYPNRIAGLVLLDGGFYDFQNEPGANWEDLAMKLAPPDFTGVNISTLLDRIKAGEVFGTWDETLESSIKSNFLIDQGGFFKARLDRVNHMKILKAIWNQDVASLYRKIECPTLIVAARRNSDDDKENNFIRHKMRTVPIAGANITKSEIVWFEDSVHDIPLQHPKILADCIADFASKLE